MKVQASGYVIFHQRVGLVYWSSSDRTLYAGARAASVFASMMCAESVIHCAVAFWNSRRMRPKGTRTRRARAADYRVYSLRHETLRGRA